MNTIDGLMKTERVTDFLTTDFLSEARVFEPKSREEYLLHLQRVYNLKLHTPFPLVVHIEPTNICNQRCIMCCHPTMKRKQQMIDEKIMLKAIHECASSPLWFLHFFFFGEPFLNKKTIQYMRIAKEKGIKNISITTNFTAVSKETIRQLVDFEINSIHISFHGLDRVRYQKIHQTDSYELVKENIDYLLAYRKEKSSAVPWVSITYVQTTESNEEMERFKKYWMKSVNSVHVSPQFEYRNGDINGNPRSVILQKNGISNSGEILARNNDSSRIACRQLWTRMVVLANGELVPCSQNIDGELSLGNLQDISIADAWTGEKMIELRMRHLSNSLPHEHFCYPCNDWDWSGRVDKRPKNRQK